MLPPKKKVILNHLCESGPSTESQAMQLQRLTEKAFECFNSIVSTQQFAILQNFEAIRSVVQLTSVTPIARLSSNGDDADRSVGGAGESSGAGEIASDGQRGRIDAKATLSGAPADDRLRPPHLLAAANPLMALEKIWCDSVGQGLQLIESLQHSLRETEVALFEGISEDENEALPPAGQPTGAVPRQCARSQLSPYDPAELQFVETLVGMLLLLVNAAPAEENYLRQITGALAATEPFRKFDHGMLSQILGRQMFIIEREPDRALATLPDRLPNPSDRRRAVDIVDRLAGWTWRNGDPGVLDLWHRMSGLLVTQPRSTVEIEPPILSGPLPKGLADR
jgi:hypothetical protein